jgi:hypothetical protein
VYAETGDTIANPSGTLPAMKALPVAPPVAQPAAATVESELFYLKPVLAGYSDTSSIFQGLLALCS